MSLSKLKRRDFHEFDLVICDEAHRTTGKTELGGEATAFTSLHSDEKYKST